MGMGASPYGFPHLTPGLQWSRCQLPSSACSGELQRYSSASVELARERENVLRFALHLASPGLDDPNVPSLGSPSKVSPGKLPSPSKFTANREGKRKRDESPLVEVHIDEHATRWPVSTAAGFVKPEARVQRGEGVVVAPRPVAVSKAPLADVDLFAPPEAILDEVAPPCRVCVGGGVEVGRGGSRPRARRKRQLCHLFLPPGVVAQVSNGVPSKRGRPTRCRCDRSRCLKRFCVCFAAGQVCQDCRWTPSEAREACGRVACGRVACGERGAEGGERGGRGREGGGRAARPHD